MKNEIMEKAASICGKAGLVLRKHAPDILVTVGIVGTIAGTVLACKATIKANDILDEAKTDLDKIHLCESDEKLSQQCTEENASRDKTIVYVQTGVKLVKLYAPALALGALSMTSILASTDILKKRSAAMAAAYTVVDAGFKEYRKNVIERFGEETDKELRYNIKAKTFEEIKVDEQGVETATATEVKVACSDKYSQYTKIFDEGNEYYEKDADYNLCFLRAQQAYANDLLTSRGYLFLNDVYEMLGFPRTKAGQVVGWLKQGTTGDGFVDFGIYELDCEKKRDFINGYERSIVLDFNVDGPILDIFEGTGGDR